MIKKIFLMVAAISLTATVLNAQESSYQGTTNQSSSERYEKQANDDKYTVATNRFGSNWFMGGGVGAETYFGDHDRQLKYWSDRITPAFHLYGGKWFTPVIGVRATVSGFKLKGATHRPDWSVNYDEPAHEVDREILSDDVVKPAGSGLLYYQQWHYMQAHADVMFNICNMFGGYKAKRIWNIIPYAGLGVMYTWEAPVATEIGATAGLLNSFRLTDGLNLNVDVYGTMTNDRFDGDINTLHEINPKARMEEGALTATIGLQYNFSPRGWGKLTDTYIIDNSRLNELRDALCALDSENQALKEQLANVHSVDSLVKKVGVTTPLLVTFIINRTDLSKKDRVNLGFFAEVIKAGDPDAVYTITGYADEGTGNPTLNMNLSRGRAKAVYDCLVHEFGVDPAHLTMDYKGGVGNMFYDDPRLSRATILKVQ